MIVDELGLLLEFAVHDEQDQWRINHALIVQELMLLQEVFLISEMIYHVH